MALFFQFTFPKTILYCLLYGTPVYTKLSVKILLDVRQYDTGVLPTATLFHLPGLADNIFDAPQTPWD
jgi:hypothetical protein